VCNFEPRKDVMSPRMSVAHLAPLTLNLAQLRLPRSFSPREASRSRSLTCG
jgi:hypothetical protein